MKWLGHYEFGRNFKPINFDHWLGRFNAPYDTNADFWLEYWSRAYQYVLNKKTSNVIFIDFDNLIEAGGKVLPRLAECIGLEDMQKLVSQSDRLRMPKSVPIASTECSKVVYRQAFEIYEQLKNSAI